MAPPIEAVAISPDGSATLPAPPDPAAAPPQPWLRAVTNHLYHLLAFAAILSAGIVYRYGDSLGGGEVLRLVFLGVAALLLAMSLFKVSEDLRTSRFTASPPAIVNLVLCFVWGFVLSQGQEPETTLVYFLGFAALIIGGQHLVEFHTAEETLRQINGQLAGTGARLMGQLEASENRISLLNAGIRDHVERQMISLRYDLYREQVTTAYKSATRRVLGSANHWPIDPQFWNPNNTAETLDDETFWNNQRVYENLCAALKRSWEAGDHRAGPEAPGKENPRLQIVFAGRLDVIPTMETSPALSTDDFLLFIGVLWRLALARRLRKAIDALAPTSGEPQLRADVRVVVADIPINAHVIDDDVYLLRCKPGDGHESSMGVKIADGNNPNSPSREADIELANMFGEIIERYARRTVRSAREYAASLLVFAAMSRNEVRDLELVNNQGQPDFQVIRGLLDTLGMQRWAQVYSGSPDAFRVDAAHLAQRATELAAYFLQYYYADRKLMKIRSRAQYWKQSDVFEVVTVDRLIEDII